MITILSALWDSKKEFTGSTDFIKLDRAVNSVGRVSAF